MKHILPYIAILLIFLPAIAFSQAGGLPETPEEYGPAVKELLTRTNKETAMSAGASFEMVWGSLSLDAKKKIMNTAKSIRERKYSIYPHLSEYFRGIVLAVENEGADAGTMLDFLNVTDKALEN